MAHPHALLKWYKVLERSAAAHNRSILQNLVPCSAQSPCSAPEATHGLYAHGLQPKAPPQPTPLTGAPWPHLTCSYGCAPRPGHINTYIHLHCATNNTTSLPDTLVLPQHGSPGTGHAVALPCTFPLDTEPAHQQADRQCCPDNRNVILEGIEVTGATGIAEPVCVVPVGGCPEPRVPVPSGEAEAVGC